MLVWRKISAAKWEDAWLERLGFLDPRRIAVFTFPNAKTVRIEAYHLTKKQAAELVARFGGQTREMPDRDFAAGSSAPSPPLRIRGRLVIFRSAAERQKHAPSPDLAALVIPAAMAFGTGGHATTATCLRMLCDVSRALPKNGWDMLDLGTGSGILALAARLLGARRADAWDFDPACIRTARENLALNRITNIRLARRDVLAWPPENKAWPVITANLYSQVLIAAAPRISHALAAGGALIFSGILRGQERETVQAFEREKLYIERVVRRGKWIAALARKFR